MGTAQLTVLIYKCMHSGFFRRTSSIRSAPVWLMWACFCPCPLVFSFEKIVCHVNGVFLPNQFFCAACRVCVCVCVCVTFSYYLYLFIFLRYLGTPYIFSLPPSPLMLPRSSVLCVYHASANLGWSLQTGWRLSP